jgi:hypothetical protein
MPVSKKRIYNMQNYVTPISKEPISKEPISKEPISEKLTFKMPISKEPISVGLLSLRLPSMGLI